MTTIRVQLAESPTDVLVWLVGSQPHARTREEIAAAMTHLHPHLEPDDALVATARALRLLHELRFVQTRGNELRLRWFPTAEGIEVVREAETAACTCRVTAKSTRFDSACPYHGDEGTMIARFPSPGSTS